MGQFANTLFSMLLGWVQTAVSWLWQLATSTDVNTWLHWLLDNWLAVLLALCIGGALVDFFVYLIRWQPYRVWRSFLSNRKDKRRGASGAVAESQPVQRKWVFADGSTEVEDLSQQERYDAYQPERLNAPIRPTRRVARRELQGQGYNQPVYPPQWQHKTQEQQGENE